MLTYSYESVLLFLKVGSFPLSQHVGSSSFTRLWQAVHSLTSHARGCPFPHTLDNAIGIQDLSFIPNNRVYNKVASSSNAQGFHTVPYQNRSVIEVPER